MPGLGSEQVRDPVHAAVSFPAPVRHRTETLQGHAQVFFVFCQQIAAGYTACFGLLRQGEVLGFAGFRWTTTRWPEPGISELREAMRKLMSRSGILTGLCHRRTKFVDGDSGAANFIQPASLLGRGQSLGDRLEVVVYCACGLQRRYCYQHNAQAGNTSLFQPRGSQPASSRPSACLAAASR